MVRAFIGFDHTKWCLNKSALNTTGRMGVYDDLFMLSQQNLRSDPQWAGDTELHEHSAGCFSRVHRSFVNVVFSCSARDLPDNIPRVTDEENVLFEAMNQKEREAFVRQRLAEYRVELARECEMLNGMTDEERKAWVDAHWSSSVMGNGRILEVQLQSEWTSDTDADIKAAAFALEQVVERKGTGDDQNLQIHPEIANRDPTCTDVAHFIQEMVRG